MPARQLTPLTGELVAIVVTGDNIYGDAGTTLPPDPKCVRKAVALPSSSVYKISKDE